MSYPHLHRLSVESGFVQRQSKLPASVFFDLLFYAASLSQNSSLEFLCVSLASQYGIHISKQSLDERFTARTVSFVKQVLAELIRDQFSDVLYNKDFLTIFACVRIKDSTRFNIPSNLASYYRGSGGGGTVSPAGVSIQYEFDLKTGKFLDLTLTEAVRNDVTDANQTSAEVCRFNLFVTNAGEEKIPLDKALPLYRFRRQVELRFKNWKSVFCVHRLQKMKESRYITMLYIRLILIVVTADYLSDTKYVDRGGAK